jgi:hypothetical protein
MIIAVHSTNVLRVAAAVAELLGAVSILVALLVLLWRFRKRTSKGNSETRPHEPRSPAPPPPATTSDRNRGSHF